jgi:hypothetical protein
MLADASKEYKGLENTLCQLFGCCVIQSVQLAMKRGPSPKNGGLFEWRVLHVEVLVSWYRGT